MPDDQTTRDERFRAWRKLGFGSDEAWRRADMHEARRQVLKEVLDQAEMMSGYELVRWLRQEVANG